MKTNILGYPRIGLKREVKRALEKYWSNKITHAELVDIGEAQRKYAWETMNHHNIDFIPSNDFSFYDHVLDMAYVLGCVPHRYQPLIDELGYDSLEVYFAMARGYQKAQHDIVAMEMTKWFDTNYHYIVPEFTKDQTFAHSSGKVCEQFNEASRLGLKTKPTLISPVSFLLLGKETEEGFSRLSLLNRLMPAYLSLINSLVIGGADVIQLDDPFLALDVDDSIKESIEKSYREIKDAFPKLDIIVATYFEGVQDNLDIALHLPIDTLHLDLVRRPDQLNLVLDKIPSTLSLSLGVVDGRNIWRNNFETSLSMLYRSVEKLGESRVMVATSCSLLHTPFDLDAERNNEVLPSEIKTWMAFAKQKVIEVECLARLCEGSQEDRILQAAEENKEAHKKRLSSILIHRDDVKERMNSMAEDQLKRKTSFQERKEVQKKHLNLPLFPTTTIGSFPQTKEIRRIRSKYKKAQITRNQYVSEVRNAIEDCIKKQEEIGLDVLVHGEFERNDMVEYFGERLEGFAFTENGWVQSYGSRGVKPPIIYGDVSRQNPMTVDWTVYAQSKTDRPMKGMLTGPVTILQWSFVRDDQPRKDTAYQLAFAIQDEVSDLEKQGIHIIQIDEPALREGLPLKKADKMDYLLWATSAFRLTSSSVQNKTQIHTHMCYAEFNEIIKDIAAMDADVITIETSRSHMQLLKAFDDFKYPNQIGPGVYDIHSPRVPKKQEILNLLEKALSYVSKDNLWVNPDCGLKTRQWDETLPSLSNMVGAAKELRTRYL